MSVLNFLRQALSARKGIDLSVLELRLSIMEWMKRLGMDPAFADRYLNEGFSGGEKKRNEILQMAILEPEIAVLDETDSGLDIDALRGRGQGRARGAHATGPSSASWPSPTTSACSTTCAPDVRAHPDRRPDRASGRSGAGRRELERRRLRGASMSDRRRLDPLDVAAIKKDFPILEREVHGRPIVYLDSADSSQKPQAVLDAMTELLRALNANVHRGVYAIAEEATAADRGRPGQGRPLHRRPPHASEVVFTKNATEALNLVAQSWGRANLQARRRRRAHPAGAPRQHRAVAHAGRRAGHRAALDPRRRRRPPRPHRPRPAARRRQGRVRSRRCPTCSARCRRCGALADAAHAAGALVVGRRLPVRAARPHRRGRPGTPTSSPSPATRCRPDRHRRAVGP